MLFISFEIKAQEVFDFEQFLQDLIPFEEERAENLDYYDQLILIYQNPINLNKADKTDLEQLYILSQSQIMQILNYRNDYGNFLSLYELQAVPGIDKNTIDKLQYFVEVKNGKSDNRSFKERLKTSDRHYFLTRIERQVEKTEAYSNEVNTRAYLGDPNKYLLRYRRARFGDYSFGLTMEKDVGEKMHWDSKKKQYGFDFISAHFYRENVSFMDKMAIGDYQLQFGQGLVFSSGIGSGKSAQTILSTKRINTGISPYGSALESGFQRGIALCIPFNKLSLSTFYSRNPIDANFSIEDSTDSPFITSISSTGIHNTKTYYERRMTSEEVLFGANLNWKNKVSTFGLTVAQQQFESNLEKDNIIRNRYLFNGALNRNISFDYDFNYLNANFFGESAISNSGGLATVHGLILALNSKTDLALHYRYFDKNFHSIRGATFSEGTNPINERGFYLGMSKKIGLSWNLKAYYDLFSFPWISYQSKAPSKGNESLIRIEKRFSRKNNIFLQLKNEQKELSNSDLNTPKKYLRQNLEWILQLSHSLNEMVSLRTRIQKKDISSILNSHGMAITQDLRLEYKKIRMDFRLSIFNTSDYQSRIYVLERDVLYSLSAPAYFGNGIRNYILLKYKASSKFDFWIKWGRLMRTDTDYLGSGLNKSLGNSRNTLKFQMKINL